LGVGDDIGGRSKREGEGSGGVCLGLLLFPSMPIEQDKQKYFQDPLTPEREVHSRSLSLPLVGLQKKEKERGIRMCKVRVNFG
jgi:hypothetical protein